MASILEILGEICIVRTNILTILKAITVTNKVKNAIQYVFNARLY